MITCTAMMGYARRIRKAVEKDYDVLSRNLEDDEKVKLKQRLTRKYMKDLNDDVYMMLEVKKSIMQIEADTGEPLLMIPQGEKSAYFITIRPKEGAVSFDEFYNDVRFISNMKSMKQIYGISFEQKGTSINDMGTGFHCHIICDLSYKSCGEVVRAYFPTFKKYCDTAAFEVLRTKGPESLVESYIENYDSSDGHKIITKETDEAWRKAMSIEPVYKTRLPIKPVLATIEKSNNKALE